MYVCVYRKAHTSTVSKEINITELNLYWHTTRCTSMHKHPTHCYNSGVSAVGEDQDVTRGRLCIQGVRYLCMEHRHQLPTMFCKQVHDRTDRESAVVVTECGGKESQQLMHEHSTGSALAFNHLVNRYIYKS